LQQNLKCRIPRSVKIYTNVEVLLHKFFNVKNHRETETNIWYQAIVVSIRVCQIIRLLGPFPAIDGVLITYKWKEMREITNCLTEPQKFSLLLLFII
jgi:hypothetical protein